MCICELQFAPQLYQLSRDILAAGLGKITISLYSFYHSLLSCVLVSSSQMIKASLFIQLKYM